MLQRLLSPYSHLLSWQSMLLNLNLLTNTDSQIYATYIRHITRAAFGSQLKPDNQHGLTLRSRVSRWPSKPSR